MTYREARRKSGSRSARRSGTNGKTIRGVRPTGGTNSKVALYRNPRPVSRKVILAVRARVRGEGA